MANLYPIPNIHERNLVAFFHEKPEVIRLKIPRVQCPCGKSHALLLDFIVPYLSYSLPMILQILCGYFCKSLTVQAICAKYFISPPVLYRFKKQFLLHKKQWLGIVRDMELPVPAFMEELLTGPFCAFHDTFLRLATYSFLQSHKNPANCAAPISGLQTLNLSATACESTPEAPSFIIKRTTKKEEFPMEEKKNNQKRTPDCDATIKTARFRFSLIAPVIQGLVPDGSDTAYFMRITKDPPVLPDGRTVRYSFKTPRKWLCLYKKGGFDALLPKTRSDKGIPRALPDTAIEGICRLKEKYPRLNAAQIHIRLVQDAFIPASVSVDAVRRFIRNNGLKSSRELSHRDRKAFEEDSFGRLIPVTFVTSMIHLTGKPIRSALSSSSTSRMIVGGGMSCSDNSCGFQKVLKEAVSTCGIPDKIYTDNGSPCTDRQLSLICGSIGTVLLHAPVRDGAAKAKVERNFRTMREKLLYGPDLEWRYATCLKTWILHSSFLRGAFPYPCHG